MKERLFGRSESINFNNSTNSNIKTKIPKKLIRNVLVDLPSGGRPLYFKIKV